MNAQTTLPTDRGQLGDVLVAELFWLIRLATRLTRDADVAEDCAQETIVGAWRRADKLRDPAALRGWLRRSLVHRVIDRARARHDELDIEAVETEWADDAWTVQPERVLDDATRKAVQDHLESCPTCLPLYAALVGVRSRMEALRDPDSVVDAAVAARIERRLRSTTEPEA